MSDLPIIEEEDDEPTAPFWMTTFSDMVTLLLTFFVLIVSMSEVEVKKFKEALSHFQGRRSVLEFETMVPPTNADEPSGSTYMEREAALQELTDYLKRNNLQDLVAVEMTRDGIHVSIVDSVMFESGRAELLPIARTILTHVGRILSPLAKRIIVEGHTDNRPIQTAQFPSNWELSGARASSVVRFFLSQNTALDPKRYEVIGYGEFRPVATNSTAEGRARNRRVEILFSHAGSN